LEGFNNEKAYEIEIKENGYPSMHHGHYTKEPEFGNLLRHAHKLGFYIFGYHGEGEDGSAKNILRKIKKGKTIVLCGWDHIKEGQTGTYWEYALAGRIKEFSGKDPFTINQTQYFERADRKYEDSLYQTQNFKEPTVLLDETKQSIDLEKDRRWYDLFVFHPRTTFLEGIPDWILKDKIIFEFKIPDIEINCPCKVLLFEEGDDIQKAVPTYMLEIPTLQKTVKMPVSKDSNYKILVANKEVAYSIK